MVIDPLPRYFKQHGQSPIFRDSPAAKWGEFTRYVEIGDDLYASRQVDDYGKGQRLWYDRDHLQDEYGILIRCLFSSKKKAICSQFKMETIDAKEFERIWKLAVTKVTSSLPTS